MLGLPETIQACSSHPIYGPKLVLEKALEQALTRDVSQAWLDQWLYTLNMFTSKNLPFIDCVLEQMKAMGA